MNTQELHTVLRKPLIAGILVFCGVLMLTQFISYQRYLLFKNSKAKELTSIANLAKEKLQSVLIKSVTATSTLSFIVKEYGVPEDFEKVAEEILESNQFVDVLELVEGDKITKVYPLLENESVIGYEVLKDSMRNKEALKAIKNKQLFFAGPLELKQGGMAVIGRLPIFIDGKYWGFAVAITKLSTLISAAKIDTADNPDYLFQLSKINPETGVEEFFLPNATLFKGVNSLAVHIQKGDWKLYVSPKQSQTLISPIPFSLLGLALSLTAGLFAWYITKQPYELKHQVDEKTKALTLSEETYRNTIERVSDSIISLDKDWNYTVINSKAAELHNQAPNKLIGKNIWKEYPDVVKEPFYDALMKAMKTQQPQMVEFYYAKIDKWFEDHIYPSPNGVTVYYRDVTEQRRITEEITREKKLSESIIKSLPGIFYLFNKDYKLLHWNKNLEIVTGYAADEISAMSPLDFFDDREKELLISKITNVFATGSDSVEANFFTKDKRKIPFFFTGYLANFENEECLIGVGFDITKRKIAEQELNDSNERFLLAAKATNDIIWDWNLVTDEISWGDSYYTSFGYPRKDTIQKIDETWDQHIHPEDKDRVLKGIYDAIKKTSFFWSDEYRFLKADRTEVQLFDRGYMIYNEQGKPLRMVGAMMDITKLKNTEHELLKSQAALRQLTAHLQTIREEERTFIAREIHDELGQQLTCLKMDASWLSKKCDTNESDTKSRLHGMISMIDETVKTVRRIASELRPGILDDLGLIAAIEWQNKEFAKHAGIEAKFKSDIWDVAIDKKVATGVFRVYQEALTNVARHSQASALETSISVQNNLLTLQISDNGIGFDLETVKHKSTLGLLGMQERVLMFGGAIDFSSNTKNGTTITVKAPLISIT